MVRVTPQLQSCNERYKKLRPNELAGTAKSMARRKNLSLQNRSFPNENVDQRSFPLNICISILFINLTRKSEEEGHR